MTKKRLVAFKRLLDIIRIHVQSFINRQNKLKLYQSQSQEILRYWTNPKPKIYRGKVESKYQRSDVQTNPEGQTNRRLGKKPFISNLAKKHAYCIL